MGKAAIDRGLAGAILNDPRWSSVVARDRDADGQFFYSVKTTGVYCRPSCAARVAKPVNVRFHKTAEEAMHAGFRPCKRCMPDQPPVHQQHAAMVAQACRFIETAEQEPSLNDLAVRAAMSRYHFHRVFRALTGVTPKDYAAAQRARRVRNSLSNSLSDTFSDTLNNKGTVTDAIYDAGYNSNGRFYATSNEILGMTPSAFRAGGAGTQIQFAIGESSLGSILVASSARGVCAILMGSDAEQLLRDLQDRFPRADLLGGDREFESVIAKVVGLIEAPAQGLDLPLDIRGTAFQQRVWQALREIPAGSTASYTAIAESIGLPKSVRAVAHACAANALAVAIPCHRVVRKDGGLSGYRWGVERKRALLDREART